ncbi:MAG TPA: hypothetical protein VEN28_01580 [Burkholderiaceae bacterium]|jgi:hypothetical protein|nr:hypothetical protein [Burkholderiaceae bacterium]
MVSTYLISEAILRMLEAGANVLLRAIGGPHHVPNTNEDFVWY